MTDQEIINKYKIFVFNLAKNMPHFRVDDRNGRDDYVDVENEGGGFWTILAKNIEDPESRKDKIVNNSGKYWIIEIGQQDQWADEQYTVSVFNEETGEFEREDELNVYGDDLDDICDGTGEMWEKLHRYDHHEIKDMILSIKSDVETAYTKFNESTETDDITNKFKIFVYQNFKKYVDNPDVEDPFLNDVGLGEMSLDYYVMLAKEKETGAYWALEVENDGNMIKGDEEWITSFIYEGGKWVRMLAENMGYYPVDGSPNRDEIQDIYFKSGRLFDHIYTMETEEIEKMFKEVDSDTLKTFTDINESNVKQEKTFLKWLSRKLQHKIGKRIGKGIEGVVHKLGKNKVIKITTTDVTEQHKSINKNIKGLAKIYNIGFIIPPKRFTYTQQDGHTVLLIDGEQIKNFQDFYKSSTNIDMDDGKLGYIIMERVDIDPLTNSQITYISDELMTVFLKRNTHKFPEDFQSIINNQRNDKNGIGFYQTLSLLYTLVQKNHVGLKKFFKENYPNLSKFNRGLLFDIIDILISIKEYYPNWTDIHSGQFGRNKNGELVAFDVGESSRWNNQIVYHMGYKRYPTPKNIIKEFKNFRPL